MDELIKRSDVLALAESGKLVSNRNYKSVCDAINGLPSVEYETDVDCISRIDILKKLNNLCNNICEYSKKQRKSMCDACNLSFVFDMIDNAKSVEPERKTGHWRLLDECANEGWYCDQCHKKVFRADFFNTMKKYKFCPNCGAKMRVNK